MKAALSEVKKKRPGIWVAYSQKVWHEHQASTWWKHLAQRRFKLQELQAKVCLHLNWTLFFLLHHVCFWVVMQSWVCLHVHHLRAEGSSWKERRRGEARDYGSLRRSGQTGSVLMRSRSKTLMFFWRGLDRLTRVKRVGFQRQLKRIYFYQQFPDYVSAVWVSASSNFTLIVTFA